MSGHNCPECGEYFTSSSHALGGSLGHDCTPLDRSGVVTVDTADEAVFATISNAVAAHCVSPTYTDDSEIEYLCFTCGVLSENPDIHVTRAVLGALRGNGE